MRVLLSDIDVVFRKNLVSLIKAKDSSIEVQDFSDYPRAFNHVKSKDLIILGEDYNFPPWEFAFNYYNLFNAFQSNLNFEPVAPNERAVLVFMDEWSNETWFTKCIEFGFDSYCVRKDVNFDMVSTWIEQTEVQHAY